MDFLNKFPDWLRWILALPACFLAHMISYPLIIFLNKATMIGFDGFFTDIVLMIIANVWSTAAFVWVGATIVPKYNFIVSIILAVIYSFMIGAGFFAKVALGDDAGVSWLQVVVAVIAGISAAVGIVHHFYKKETFTKDYSPIH